MSPLWLGKSDPPGLITMRLCAVVIMRQLCYNSGRRRTDLQSSVIGINRERSRSFVSLSLSLSLCIL